MITIFSYKTAPMKQIWEINIFRKECKMKIWSNKESSKIINLTEGHSLKIYFIIHSAMPHHLSCLVLLVLIAKKKKTQYKFYSLTCSFFLLVISLGYLFLLLIFIILLRFHFKRSPMLLILACFPIRKYGISYFLPRFT